MVSPRDLLDFINEEAKKEHEDELKVEEQKRLFKEAEEKERVFLMNEIYDFFKPLYAPRTYTITLASFQILSQYMYLNITTTITNEEQIIIIWVTNDYDSEKPLEFQHLYKQSYDFVKKLYFVKEEILMEIAKKYGYEFHERTV